MSSKPLTCKCTLLARENDWWRVFATDDSENGVWRSCPVTSRHSVLTAAPTKIQEAEMEVSKLKMLRFSLEVTRLDKIRNEYIKAARFGEKTRQARRGWFGHVCRNDDGYIGRRMIKTELTGKRKLEDLKGGLWMR